MLRFAGFAFEASLHHGKKVGFRKRARNYGYCSISAQRDT
jgi:hypothetical protein